MSKFTCTLPNEFLQKLNEMAIKLSVPKNRIIDDALHVYFDQMKCDEYVKSFEKAGKNFDFIKMVGLRMDISQSLHFFFDNIL